MADPTPAPESATQDLDYWRRRAAVVTSDLTDAGITNASPVFAWMQARGWSAHGFVGRVETGFFHKASGSRFRIQGWHSLAAKPDPDRRGPVLAALLVTTDSAYLDSRDECPHDALADLVKFAAEPAGEPSL